MLCETWACVYGYSGIAMSSVTLTQTPAYIVYSPRLGAAANSTRTHRSRVDFARCGEKLYSAMSQRSAQSRDDTRNDSVSKQHRSAVPVTDSSVSHNETILTNVHEQSLAAPPFVVIVSEGEWHRSFGSAPSPRNKLMLLALNI